MHPVDGRPDVIEIRGLRVSGICGVLPEEQARPQPLLIDLELEADLMAAGASDDLTDTVDYATVAARVEALVATGRVALLEHLAARIADTCLEDERVAGATVHIRKLRPPVPQLLDSTGVRITRRR
jgi:dihydroneopterin aldolase